MDRNIRQIEKKNMRAIPNISWKEYTKTLPLWKYTTFNEYNLCKKNKILQVLFPK